MAIQLSEADARRLLGDDVVRQAGKRHIKAAMNRWESQYAFTVFVVPMGAPRMTKRDKWKRRPIVIRYRKFKDAIRAAAGIIPPPEIILSLSWTAFFSPPASWSVKKRIAALGQLHRSKPDRDNIDKGILDALFEQDSGIASGQIEKRWGEPSRLEVTILVG